MLHLFIFQGGSDYQEKSSWKWKWRRERQCFSFVQNSFPPSTEWDPRGQVVQFRLGWIIFPAPYTGSHPTTYKGNKLTERQGCRYPTSETPPREASPSGVPFSILWGDTPFITREYFLLSPQRITFQSLSVLFLTKCKNCHNFWSATSGPALSAQSQGLGAMLSGVL